MNKENYQQIEAHMLGLMTDSAHDPQHIYRVLYYSLDIARGTDADMNVVIAAALLHDIGRAAEYADHGADHATIGADMAYHYLLQCGWEQANAFHVKSCIATHRYRSDAPPQSPEAKILFDADKLDATGVMGIARTILYKGIVSQPLYNVDGDGQVSSGEGDKKKSVFQEYNWKLKGIYGKFHTERAAEIARTRQQAAINCYEALYGEAASVHAAGLKLLNSELDD